MGRSIFLSYASTSRKATFRRLQSAAKPLQWLFFGRNYLQALDWERTMHPVAVRYDITQHLVRTAERLREPFLNRITELGVRHDSLVWWASRLAERNPMVSPLFLYCCYLSMGVELLASGNGSLCVVSESWVLLQCLSDAAEKKGCSVIWVRRPLFGLRELVSGLRTGIRVARFFRGALSGMYPESNVSQSSPGALVLLRTWLDESCFGQDCSFHDRYLPGVCSWLEAHGFQVLTMPVLFNLKRSPRSAWQWLRQNKQRFLNPYRYYRLSDYAFALRTVWRQARMDLGPVHLDHLDVTALFADARDYHAYDSASLDAILSYHLPERLRQAGFQVALFIDEFENLVPEKLLILGFRHFIPAAKLVGFQHGIPCPMLLSLFVTSREAEIAPLPDRIVCGGDFFREVLISGGLPAERIATGPPLRYKYLSRPVPLPNQTRKNTAVLAALPLPLDAAAELLMKLICAFHNAPDIQIKLKPHPMSSADVLLRSIRIRSLPANFEIVSCEIEKCLGQVSLVIGSGGSAVFEALAAGLPVISVGRDADITLDPLGWFPHLSRICYGPEEIRLEALRMLSLSEHDLEVHHHSSREVLNKGFGPVDEVSFRVFVDGLASANSRGATVGT